MKILLDENVPHALRLHLRLHESIPAAHMGWGGWKNGEPLNAAENAGFDVLVTGDRSLEYQENMKGRKIAIVSLSANNRPIIRNHIGKIAAAVNAAKAGSFLRVDCGVFSRRRRKPRETSLD